MLWSCVMHMKGCLPPLFILSLTATSLSASCQWMPCECEEGGEYAGGVWWAKGMG